MSQLPDPHALFFLIPKNDNARAVVAHPLNQRHVTTSPSGAESIRVGPHIRGKSSETLATMGRGYNADIYVNGHGISRIQCSFEMDLESGVVMLHDRSTAGSTQVFGENCIPFQENRYRKILVQQGLNTIVGMGGEQKNLLEFTLEWHQDPSDTARLIQSYRPLDYDRMKDPRLYRTVTGTPMPPQDESHELGLRYVSSETNKLGSGTFGNVFKAINADSGNLMAVKILKKDPKMSQQMLKQMLQREVDILSQIKHPHIVRYIGVDRDKSNPEIFMDLKEGDLRSLVESGADASAIARLALPQMLLALDYIAQKGIIHRDVKPENILYNRAADSFIFQLGDFGLCNWANNAVSRAGTDIYMAPEISKSEPQTTKADVWSLFVTILWTLDVANFRSKPINSIAEAHDAVSSAVSTENLISSIREMAAFDPEQRASAAQMLAKHSETELLGPPQNEVPDPASPARCEPEGPGKRVRKNEKGGGSDTEGGKMNASGSGRNTIGAGGNARDDGRKSEILLGRYRVEKPRNRR